jgi:hypothetical protein
MDQVYRIIKLGGAGDVAGCPLIFRNQVKKTVKQELIVYKMKYKNRHK